MAGPASLRHYIDLIEGKKAPQAPWGFAYTPLFQDSLKRNLVVFPDLNEKLKKFIETKSENPLANRYGKHDGPMTGPLAGFLHCHLRDDAILIYNLKGRTINLVAIVTHSEIEGRRQKLTQRIIAPFK